MKKLMKRENFIAIALEIVLHLVGLGIFIPIVSQRSRAPKSKNDRMAVNGYFRILGTNLVWMHVQHGYGIIINEFITTKQGKQINLVEMLSKYYWFIDFDNNAIKCAELNYRTLWRCIGSVILYGNIKVRMPRWLEVHHKWWKWSNTAETLVFVCRQKHKFFHDHINSRKSHRRGKVINGIQEAKSYIGQIIVETQKWKNIYM